MISTLKTGDISSKRAFSSSSVTSTKERKKYFYPKYRKGEERTMWFIISYRFSLLFWQKTHTKLFTIYYRDKPSVKLPTNNLYWDLSSSLSAFTTLTFLPSISWLYTKLPPKIILKGVKKKKCLREEGGITNFI